MIRGQDAFRDYWEEGLRRIPDLHYEIVGLYVGVEVILINYQIQRGVLVNEVLVFGGDIVIPGYGRYTVGSSDPDRTLNPA